MGEMGAAGLRNLKAMSFSGGGQAYSYTSSASSARGYTFSWTGTAASSIGVIANSKWEGFVSLEGQFQHDTTWELEVGGSGTTGALQQLLRLHPLPPRHSA